MKISRSAGYAIALAVYVAQHCQEGPVLAILISKQYDIPIAYLYKILQQLVKANILRSKKGPRGGSTLVRPAKEITILEIIEAIEGPMLRHLQLVEQTNNEPFILKMEKVCQSSTEKVKELYGKVKLSEIIK